MYLSDFQAKLKKLNPCLWIDRGNISYGSNKELGACGIYLRQKYEKPLDTFGLGAEDYSAVNHINTRNMVHVGWVTHHWVPEGNQYEVPKEFHQYKGAKLESPGWREILLKLYDAGHIDIQRARKVFDCPGLGYSDWDNLDHFQKVQKAHGSDIYDKKGYLQRKLNRLSRCQIA